MEMVNGSGIQRRGRWISEYQIHCRQWVRVCLPKGQRKIRSRQMITRERKIVDGWLYLSFGGFKS